MAKTRKKENAMRASSIAAAGLLLALAGCRQQVVINPNDAPIADARAIDPATMAATEGMITVPYAGSPVTVTLDATQSRDGDGLITQYRWMVGNTVDGGAGRVMPDGQPGWPADTARVDVTLDQGEWIFNLWVVDDEGLISEADTILVNIGVDPVVACMDMVVDAVSEACRMCMCEMESCRAAVVESGCDAACWGLIQCVGANCPNYMEMVAMGDTSCFTTGACGMAYGAAQAGTTPTGSMAAGVCARACPDACSSAMMMGM